MNLYSIFNKLLLIEYTLMVIFAFSDKRLNICIYWIGAVILQLGIILGLK